MHSIHGRGSFSTNSSISEVWHGRAQCGIAKALLSLQLFFLKNPIGSGQECWQANQAQ